MNITEKSHLSDEECTSKSAENYVHVVKNKKSALEDTFPKTYRSRKTVIKKFLCGLRIDELRFVITFIGELLPYLLNKKTCEIGTDPLVPISNIHAATILPPPSNVNSSVQPPLQGTAPCSSIKPSSVKQPIPSDLNDTLTSPSRFHNPPGRKTPLKSSQTVDLTLGPSPVRASPIRRTVHTLDDVENPQKSVPAATVKPSQWDTQENVPDVIFEELRSQMDDSVSGKDEMGDKKIKDEVMTMSVSSTDSVSSQEKEVVSDSLNVPDVISEESLSQMEDSVSGKAETGGEKIKNKVMTMSVSSTVSASFNTSEHFQLKSNCKSFECKFCGKLFTRKADMKTHKKIHSNEEKFSCTGCNKVFSKTSSLILHIKNCKVSTATINDNEKYAVFKCELCPKTFKHKSNLTSHKVIHSGKKPYICNQCGKGFPYSFTKKRHEKGCDGKSSDHLEGSNTGQPFYQIAEHPQSFSVPRSHAPNLPGLEQHHPGSHPVPSTVLDPLDSHVANPPGQMRNQEDFPVLNTLHTSALNMHWAPVPNQQAQWMQPQQQEQQFWYNHYPQSFDNKWGPNLNNQGNSGWPGYY